MFGTEGIPWGNPKTAKDEGNQIGSSYKSKTLKECKDLCNEQVRDGCQSFRWCDLVTAYDVHGNAYGYHKLHGVWGECYLFDKILSGNEATTNKRRYKKGWRPDGYLKHTDKTIHGQPITDDCTTFYRHCSGNNPNT